MLNQFANVVRNAQEHVGFNFQLRSEQLEAIAAITERKDCLCVLPTGYGKSLIYQLLPFVFDELSDGEENSCVVVVSPLNAIIEDQISKLSPVF